MTNIVKRISVGEFIGNLSERRNLIQSNSGKAIVRVIGKAHAVLVSEKEDSNGKMARSVKFKGTFEATNLLTGQQIASSNLYLPEVASDMLEPLVAGYGNGSIGFGFDIGGVTKDTPIGYEYFATPLIKADGADPLADLRAAIPQLGYNAQPDSETESA